MKDRFDLEQAIMALWHTAEDIECLYESFYDGRENWTTDRMANALLGLHELVNARGDKCMHVFEQVYQLNAYASEEAKEYRRKVAERLMDIDEVLDDILDRDEGM